MQKLALYSSVGSLGSKSLLLMLLICLAVDSVSVGQSTFLTGRSDSQRTAANTNESLLTPANVHANSFGHLFSQSIDYQALAQPLYVPNVTIPGLGTHNVVYVATMADSVYAFDADDNQGANASPLWSVNFTDPGNGITLASYADKTLPCTNANSTGPGFNHEGIASTPVIDSASGTLYVVAKTVENGTVRHRLHALDITTGQEKFGGPVLIAATFTSNAGRKVTFNSLHQKNRPGLLLLNGTVYMAFGSNYCNDNNQSWVLAYDATSLEQLGVFDVNPDHGLSSIWQSGQGITADADGNIYVSTSEGKFDVNLGGQGYASSVLKLSPNPVALADFFTPSNVDYLYSHDLDLSSSGPIVVPDQTGQPLVVAAGKQGTIYVLNPNLPQPPGFGGYTQGGPDQIPQELNFAVGPMFDSPAYWNGMVYFAGNADVIKGFSVGTGSLSAQPIITTTQKYVGAHSPSISANTTSNGILWVMSGQHLDAFDATSLELLYSTPKNLLPPTAHFATQTVVNGKVYVATQTTLEVYGLFPALNVVSGGNQSGTVFTDIPLQFQATDPYSGAPIAGLAVNFSDGGKGGTFDPSTATTDNSGNAPTTYTLPKKAGSYAIAASAPGLASASTSETAVPGAPTKLAVKTGNQQTGAAGTVLPAELSARVVDQYGNGVPAVSVSMEDGNAGGVFSPNPCASDSSGLTHVQYQLPTKAGTYSPKAHVNSLTVKFVEYSVAGPAANIAATGGNNQTAPAGTQLPQALTVVVTDQYGNPVPGLGVTFDDGGAGGQFSSNPVTTDSSGTASDIYTLPSAPGTINITATVSGVGTPATFTETGQ